jgi:hypothetical protein
MRRLILAGLAAACFGLAAPAADAATSLKSLQKSIAKLQRQVNTLSATVNAKQTQINSLRRDVGAVSNQNLNLVSCLQRSVLDDSPGYAFDGTTAPGDPIGGTLFSDFATTIDLPGAGQQNVPFASPVSMMWAVGVRNVQGCLNLIPYHSPYSTAPAGLRAQKVASLDARRP